MYLLGPMAIEERLRTHPKTALERLADLDEWLTEALLDPPRLMSMPEYVCFTRSVRDRVTQIREQLEDA